ncbi:MAG: NAD(P)-dependent alcohol dehydrogenase [Phycisphaerales bacterium]|nr:NAD(P)-dependent alcohol dehydrogenase [Phycisphaerales bacterium]
MRTWCFHQFGCEHLQLCDLPEPVPGPGEIVVDVRALSLNYRDLMVVKGLYNPRLKLPATPISDGAGVVTAVGTGVTRVRVGEEVVSHFLPGWIDGPFRGDVPNSALGTPGEGLATERVVLPAEAVLPLPAGYTMEQAATLPIAALTAWSALHTVADLQSGQTVLTLGTGGVAIFTLQLAKALGARVLITSSSDAKLERCRALGADGLINYRTTPEWDAEVLRRTDGLGVDVTVETAGPGTLDLSMRATRAGGIIALLGALTGRQGGVTTGLILMKRLQIHGIMVDSRAAFQELIRFLETHQIAPVIDRRFGFDELPAAFRCMESGAHFGKIVVSR